MSEMFKRVLSLQINLLYNYFLIENCIWIVLYHSNTGSNYRMKGNFIKFLNGKVNYLTLFFLHLFPGRSMWKCGKPISINENFHQNFCLFIAVYSMFKSLEIYKWNQNMHANTHTCVCVVKKVQYLINVRLEIKIYFKYFFQFQVVPISEK